MSARIGQQNALQSLKSKCNYKEWRHTLDIQQAFLELWWKQDNISQSTFFPPVQSIQEQSAFFFEALNSVLMQLTAIRNQIWEPQRKAKFIDAITFIGDQLSDWFSENNEEDLPSYKNSLNSLDDVINRLSLEPIMIQAIVAYFLIEKLWLFIDLLPRPSEFVALEEFDASECENYIKSEPPSIESKHLSYLTEAAKPLAQLKTLTAIEKTEPRIEILDKENKIKTIVYNAQAGTILYKGVLIISPRQKRYLNLFLALKDGKNLRKKPLIKSVWPSREPASADKEINDVISDFRNLFNKFEEGVGTAFFPDATNSIYAFNLNEFKIVEE